MDDVVLADNGHLAPALLVIGRACVRHREVGVGSDDAAYLVQWFNAGFAREHLVLDRVSADALVLRQTARPQASSASRPACVSRPAVDAGAHPTWIRSY